MFTPMLSTPTMAIRTVTIGLFVGILGTVLTFQHQIGLGATLLGIAFLGALIVLMRLQGVRPGFRNFLMMIPILFFCVMLTLRSAPILTAMNIGAIAVSLLLLVYCFRNHNMPQLGVLEYPINAILSACEVCFWPLHELSQAGVWMVKHREGLPTPGQISYGSILRGGVITLPVVAVFVALLSAADEVFARLVGDMLKVFSFENASLMTQRTLYAGVIAWVAIGCLAVALIERKAKRKPKRDEADPESEETATEATEQEAPKPFFSIGFTEATMLLGSVCAVFAAFVMIQFVYLFGGQRNITNFSYADYVHRGFTELVLVAVLTLGLELILSAIVIYYTDRQGNILRGLSTVLILLTAVILVSAFQRLRLYELTYGFTSRRLLIYVFIGWLGFLFAGFVLSLYWIPRSVNVFSITALIAVYGFVGTLDVINPDYFVAVQNINRGDVDPVYLWLLSDSSAPALVTLVDAPEQGIRRIVRYTLARYRSDLQYRLEWQKNDGDWRDFNIERSNIMAVLERVRDKLDTVNSESFWGGKFRSEDFKRLRRGMTVREVVRQFGFPSSRYNTDLYGEFSRADNKLSVSYFLEDYRYIDLVFDSATGLESMCLVKEPYSGCTSLPLIP